MADTENLQTMVDTEDPQTMVDTEDPDKFAEEIIETGMEIVETRKTVRKSYIIQEVSTCCWYVLLFLQKGEKCNTFLF